MLLVKLASILPERALRVGLAAALSCTVVVPRIDPAFAIAAEAVAQDRIERVVDGDTLVLSKLGRVRLIGMNTPETVAPAQRQGAPPQCYGPEASAATKALLPAGTAVRLETDKAPEDKFGRTLAYVYREPDDLFINGRLVEQGASCVLPATRAARVTIRALRRLRSGQGVPAQHALHLAAAVVPEGGQGAGEGGP